MSTPQPHRINRLVIDVTGCPPDLGRALQAGVQAACLRDWLPAIERVCDRLGDPQRVQRIERLDIDLGPCPLPALQDRWDDPQAGQAIAQALVQALEERLAAPLAHALNQAPAVDRDVELCSSFLHTGVLPWWADVADRHSLRRAAEALSGRPATAWRAVLNAGPDRTLALRRLAGSLDDAGLHRVLACLHTGAATPATAPASNAGWPERWATVLSAAASRLQRPAAVLRQAWWVEALAAAMAPGTGAAAMPTAVARRLGVAEAALPTALRQAWAEASGTTAAAEETPALFAAVMGQNPLRASAPRAVPVPLDPTERTEANPLPGLVHGRAPTPSAPPTPSPASAGEGLGEGAVQPTAPHPEQAWRHTQAEQALLVPNAGLVLLWPFLPTFMARLNLAREGRWTDPTAAQRAAVLLQCAASGDTEPPEFQLPLNKLLCGLPLDQPLDPAAPPGPDEVAECEALLQAALAQAPMLGQLSVAGLRGSFLLRPGQLSGRDGHALLHVERRSYDLLLERLPWSAGIVRLPWMPALLQVQW